MPTFNKITIHTNLSNRLNGNINCCRCGKSLHIKEEVWGRFSGHRQLHKGHTIYYCIDCYKDLWI